jgi:hypothetical protein
MPIGKKSEHFKEWASNVEQWKATFGTPIVFDITSVVVVKRCAKCGSARRRMSRHHKGHEYLLACILPDCFAARYCLFHPDDCAWLCNRCHVRIHVLYKEIVANIFAYIQYRQDQSLPPEVYRLEIFRKQMVAIFEKWVAYKPLKRKKKRRRQRTNDKIARISRQ